MAESFTRRSWLAGALGTAAFASRPKGVLVDTHVHLFDPEKFPYHPQATYKPPAEPLEAYLKVVKEAGIDHTIVVHPEPYQDDHRYLEYCFEHEPSRGFFKGDVPVRSDCARDAGPHAGAGEEAAEPDCGAAHPRKSACAETADDLWSDSRSRSAQP